MSMEAKVPGVEDTTQEVVEARLEAKAAIKRFGRRRLIWRRFRRNKTAMFGLVVFGVLAFLAIFGPRLLAQWGYMELDRGAYLQGPSGKHWFGTTQQGRDLFAMSVRGLGKSMIIGLVVGLCATSIAAVVGAAAAYYQGWIERITMWVIDLLLVLPSFIITAIVLKNTSPGNGIWLLIVFLIAFGWMLSARVVRTLTMAVREREYVTAARYMGVGGFTIILRHIIPNISSLLIVDATLGIASAVLAETSLSFFGLGIRPPETSLGTLIGEGARMATTFPWTFLSGAVPLVMMVLAINFIGDGLRDALDPTSASGGHA